MYKKMNKNKTLNIPPRDTKRWVKSRKLAVVNAIQAEAITKEEACERYGLSPEELSSWFRLIENHGPDGLRTTHLKRYRAKDIMEQSFQLSEENHSSRT